MKDWAAPIFAAALFALLSPGLLFQMPGKHQPVGILNMKTSIASILVHAVIYGGGYTKAEKPIELIN
ncbi:hypothetical protein Syun_020226 [Stephania yunnanensis]|uniref:Uncharacterized protein n=1 Tax=Stephania yunnanensis TaxID=152371 RepID=A0AAP0IDF6_9MAGN